MQGRPRARRRDVHGRDQRHALPLHGGLQPRPGPPHASRRHPLHPSTHHHRRVDLRHIKPPAAGGPRAPLPKQGAPPPFSPRACRALVGRCRASTHAQRYEPWLHSDRDLWWRAGTLSLHEPARWRAVALHCMRSMPLQQAQTQISYVPTSRSSASCQSQRNGGLGSCSRQHRLVRAPCTVVFMPCRSGRL